MKHKKISIDHLEKKSGLSKDVLQKMFFENGITKKEHAKKVNKKAAKFFLRDQQGLNQYGYSKYGFLDGLNLRRLSFFILGLTGLFGLLGLTSEVQEDMLQMAGKTHAVASIGSTEAVETTSVMFETPRVQEGISGSELGILIEGVSQVMEETEISDTSVHFTSPSKLPKTGTESE